MHNPYFRKKVLVVGAGVSGISAANLLVKNGSHVKLTTLDYDRQRWGENLCKVLDKRVKLEVGQHTREFASDAHVVVVSPGVKRSNAVVRWALKNSVPVHSEIECACHFAKAPIIAITGSNGKSTTVELTAKILKNSGLHIRLGGNLDIPFSALVDQEGTVDYYLLEISSFQLEWIESFSPWVGVLLNISPNHLDHHPSYEDYIDNKFKIFNRQTARDYFITTDSVLNKFCDRVGQLEGVKIAVDNFDTSDGLVFLRNHTIWGHYPGSLAPREIVSVGDIRIPGKHNVSNVMVACAVSVLCAVDTGVVRETIKAFYGLAHRIEKFNTQNGVVFVDDSKSTSPGATRAAVETVAGPVVLLMGGLDKGCSFDELKPAVAERVKLLVSFGAASKVIADAFEDLVRIIEVSTLQEAVAVSMKHAVVGDTVLLSPACASFDMFSSYKERGKVFKETVNESQRNMKTQLGVLGVSAIGGGLL